MPTLDDYLPYLIIVAGGLAVWAVAAWHGRVRRRDAWQPAQPGDTPGELVPGEGDVVDDLMAVAEHVDVDPQPTFRRLSDDAKSGASLLAKSPDAYWPPQGSEPTARYEPCTHQWPTDEAHPCGDGHWHRCTRLPGGHRLHVCICGATPDAAPVVLVVDPPVVPAYVPPPDDDDIWVTFRGYRVHRVCLAGSLRGHVVRDGCAAHLDKAGVA